MALGDSLLNKLERSQLWCADDLNIQVQGKFPNTFSELSIKSQMEMVMFTRLQKHYVGIPRYHLRQETESIKERRKRRQ